MSRKQILGRNPGTGRCNRVLVEDGIITSIEGSDETCDLWISAGLIDLQVNGYAGLDFNGEDIVPQTVVELVEAMLTTGVTCFAPTVITAPEAVILRSLRVIADAREGDSLAAACIPFVHMEGPHISPIDGYRGAHPQEPVRPPSLAEFDRWQEACGGLVGLVTLSPHFEESEEYISSLTAVEFMYRLGIHMPRRNRSGTQS